MRNVLRRAAVVLGVATVTLGISAAPALAARGDGCPRGACGSATWTWQSGEEAVNISMSVKDTADDGHPVYIQFYVYPGGWETSKKVVSGGKGASTTWNGLRVHDGHGISGLE